VLAAAGIAGLVVLFCLSWWREQRHARAIWDELDATDDEW
jgi:hypothetical protein